MNEATRVPSPRGSRTRGLQRVALGLVMAAAVTGAVSMSAWARGPGGGGDFGGPGMFIGGPEHIGHAVDHLLAGLNTTDAQRAQITQIVQAAATDLKAQHETGRSLHQQGLQLFAAPVVDARAVEALRQQSLAQHDQASKRVTQALLDISAVLTPDQRVKLVARIQQRGEHMHARWQHHGASAPAN